MKLRHGQNQQLRKILKTITTNKPLLACMSRCKGVTVANKGLNEYEILGDDIMAVTLLRASGEG